MNQYLEQKAAEFVRNGGAARDSYDHAREALSMNPSAAMEFVHVVEQVSGAPIDPVSGHGREYWRLLISASTRGLDDEQLDRAADIALEHGCGAWHAAAVACGNVDKCCCVPCQNLRAGS